MYMYVEKTLTMCSLRKLHVNSTLLLENTYDATLSLPELKRGKFWLIICFVS